MTVGYVVTIGSVPSPQVQSWADAFATRDIYGTIEDWYIANTGHDPGLSYLSVDAELQITSAWLTANNGNGRVTFNAAEGRWYVERYRCTGAIRVDTNNVTLSNMHMDSAGALYGFRSTSNASGIILEHSTLAGNNANTSGAAINFSDASDPDQIIMRNVSISGFRAGVYSFGGTTAEYCYIHHLYYPDPAHSTGASFRGPNSTLRRCGIFDGNSACISFYAERAPYTGILAEECVLTLPPADTVGPEVLCASGRPYSDPLPGETRQVVGCLFYRGGNRGEGGGIGGYRAGWSDGAGGSGIRGNFDRLGTPVL